MCELCQAVPPPPPPPGVGAKRGRDDDWIDQQNSFDELLQELNSHKEEHSPAPGGISTNESQPLIASATQAKKLVLVYIQRHNCYLSVHDKLK